MTAETEDAPTHHTLVVGEYTPPESVCRNRRAVTDFVTERVTVFRFGLVFEVFSCEATEEEAGCRGLWFCNVAARLCYGFCYA